MQTSDFVRSRIAAMIDLRDPLAVLATRLPWDATQIGRFRVVVGEAGLEQLLKATINTAVAIKVVKPEELERVIVDTAVQDKAIAHLVDSRRAEVRFESCFPYYQHTAAPSSRCVAVSRNIPFHALPPSWGRL